jgi:hypothetical protein
MRHDELTAFWVCNSCLKGFAFATDLLSHRQNRGHTLFSKIDLETYDKMVLSKAQSDLDWQIRNR